MGDWKILTYADMELFKFQAWYYLSNHICCYINSSSTAITDQDILVCLGSLAKSHEGSWTYRTLIGFKAFGPENLFNVAIAAASGSAIVKTSSPIRFPKPALFAAVKVASFASSDYIAGNVI
jgi:hypothetical protein